MPKKLPTIDLSKFPNPILQPSDVLRHVRTERAEAERRRSEHVMPLVTGCDYGDLLFRLDESDPLFQDKNQDNNSKGTISSLIVSTNTSQNNKGNKYTTTQKRKNTSEFRRPTKRKPKRSLIEEVGDANCSDSFSTDSFSQQLFTTNKAGGANLIKEKSSGKVQRNSSTKSIADINTKFSKKTIEREQNWSLSRGRDTTTELISDTTSEDEKNKLHPEECVMLKKILRRISEDEERYYLTLISKNILKAEEKEMLSVIGDKISAALNEAVEPGGKVLYSFDPRSKEIAEGIVELQKKWDIWEEKELLSRMLFNVKEERKLEKLDPTELIISCIDYGANEDVTAIKEFPKYVGASRTLLWTKEMLQEKVVNKLSYLGINFENFHLAVQDKHDTLDTVIVEMSGTVEIIQKIERFITIWIQAKQMQYVSLASSETILKMPLSAKERSARASKRSIEMYNRFCSKYETLREIEFSGLNAQLVKSAMWQAHKKKFGPVCNANCKCAVMLGEITYSVLSKSMKKQEKMRQSHRKKSDLQRMDRAVGFIDCFAPKFTALLQQAYPNDTNEHIYRRLVHMWEEHRKQLRFGLNCRHDCPCVDGWASVFRKGRLRDESCPMEKENKKRKLLPSLANEKRGILNPNQTGMKILQIPKKNAGAANPVIKPKEFQIKFDTKQQLGFFVTTKKSQMQKNEKKFICKIFSVNSIGCKKDSRLCVDTIILAASVGKEQLWHDVHSHEELRTIYEKAKREGRELHIRFINRDVKGVKMNYDYAFWSNNGSWRGKNVQGWAGGATNISNPLRIGKNNAKLNKKKLSLVNNIDTTRERNSNYKKIYIEDAKQMNEAEINFGTRSCEENNNQISDANQALANPCHRKKSKRDIPSIFRKNPRYNGAVKAQTNRTNDSVFRKLTNVPKRSEPVRVKWSEIFDTRVYFPKDKVFKAPQKAFSMEEKKVPNSVAEIRTSNDLIDSINQSNSNRLFGLLSNGTPTRPTDKSVKQPVFYAIEREEYFRNELRKNPNEETKRRADEATMKVKLIKIFEEATKTLDKCRWVKRWRGYEFTIDCVKDFCITNAIPTTHGMQMKCLVTLQNEPMREMPLIEISHTIQWNLSVPIYYRFYHNSSMPKESQSKNYGKNSFLLMIVYPDGKRVKVGEYSFSQNDLVSKARGKSVGSHKAIFQPTKYLTSASILISIKKSRDRTRKRIQDQQGKAIKDYKNLIFTMKQFNEDNRWKALTKPELTVNTRFGDTTPLHAAVYLNIVDLVKEAMNMGGNPNNKFKGFQSPRELALDLSEHMAITHKSSSKDEDTLKHEEWLKIEKEKCRGILEILGFGKDYKNTVVASSLPQKQPDKGGTENKYNIDETGFHCNSGASTHRINARKQDSIYDAQISPEKTKTIEPSRLTLPNESLFQFLQGKQICKYYGHNKGCNRGKRCPYAHVEKILPQDGLKVGQCQIYFRENDVMTSRRNNYAGDTFFTATYYDRESHIYLPVAGGNCCGQNEYGIHWYKTEGEAKKAMQFVITAWKNRNLREQRASTTATQHQKLPSLNRLDHLDNNSKITSVPGNTSRRNTATMEEETFAFQNLIFANISNNLEIMTRKSLQKNEWKIRESRAGINASFTHKIAPNIEEKKFVSSFHGGATEENGEWFHMDIERAKASAFVEFLKFCKLSGFALSLISRIDGTILPYARNIKKSV